MEAIKATHARVMATAMAANLPFFPHPPSLSASPPGSSVLFLAVQPRQGRNGCPSPARRSLEHTGAEHKFGKESVDNKVFTSRRPINRCQNVKYGQSLQLFFSPSSGWFFLSPGKALAHKSSHGKFLCKSKEKSGRGPAGRRRFWNLLFDNVT